ncbi:MAG: ABC transporter permease, partial [Rhodospirillaceae bacterium]
MAAEQAVNVSPERFESGTALALKQLLRNRAAALSAAFLLLLCIFAAFAPFLAPYEPATIALSDKLLPPSSQHWMGTDYFGRDVFSRLIFGARVSLFVGLSVVAFTLVFGVPIGLMAGFSGGRVDNLLMRLMDALLTFPPLLLGIAVVGLLGADIETVTIALGVMQVPILARIVRGSTMSVRQEPYIMAARAQGASPRRIVAKHVLHNILSPLVVQI